VSRLLLITAGLLTVAGGLVYWQYRTDLEAAGRRAVEGSQVAQTACGPIEYAVLGQGPAVLLVHGAGGGHTQVAGFSELLAEAGFQAVAMSRFGYLRTPMPADASATAQADAHACLLDALGIQRAAALGASAGAPSATAFCLRHAARCTALVLLVPATYFPGREQAATTPPSPFMQFVLEHVLMSDFVMWSVTRLRPEILIETALATPLEDFESASLAEQQRALSMVRDIFPVGPKALGLKNDAAVSGTPPRFELGQIAAPTLAISVGNDLYGTYAGAQYAAGQIPGARFIGYTTGGHVWLGHDAEVQRAIVGFLRGGS
jgi:2-hydroxy-6-oxonona-2,4-dienedioate hydrolase